MSKFKLGQNVLPVLFILAVSAYSGWTQTPKNSPPQDPTQNPIKVSPEAKDVYKKWLSNDVKDIITDAETKAFLALQTDEERENFIAYFWQRRDPTPDTDENEYREEHYERITYANEHFSSGGPGSKTDRGRIYIRWGKPDSIESHPSGGLYNRPGYEGGGDTTTYPFEIWFYRHLDNVGDGLEIEFVDRTGTGEYRLARDADEKNALESVPGIDQTGAGNGTRRSFQREQDSPFSRALRIAALETPPQIKFGDLDPLASGNSGVVLDKDPLQVDLRVDFFRQSDNQVITAFTVQTNNQDLQFKELGGLQVATMNIFGRVTAVSGKRSGIFEDSVTTNATTSELVDTRDRKSVYQKAIALTPGTYKVAVVVRDTETGNKGIANLGFVVPKYDEKKLSTSSMVLTSKLRATNESDIGRMFVIGNAKVIPNLSGTYKLGQEVGIYLQVYNAVIDQTTLRPAVDVDYVLTKGGKEILRQTEDWSGLSDSGQRLTLARLLPTTRIPAGDYEIRVQIKDRVGGPVIENKGKFTIAK